MKIDFTKTTIAFGISALLAYACYSIAHFDNIKLLLAVVAGIVLTLTSTFFWGISLEGDYRKAIMVKTASGVFFALFLVINLGFAFFDFNKPAFVIINGILILLFALIVSSVWKLRTK